MSGGHAGDLYIPLIEERDRMKAILTGASGVIGKGILSALTEMGYDVVCCCRSQSQDLLDLVDNAKCAGRNTQLEFLDLRDDDSIQNCLSRIDVWCGRKVDALINCAGMAHGGLVNMTKMRDLKEVFQVNYFGQLMLTQTVSRYMQRNGGGRIINIASHAGIRADRGTLAYATSKAALIHATRIMSAEYASSSIAVNAIAPSVVASDMADQMDKTALKRLLDMTNTGKLVEVEEVVSVVKFLLREAPLSFTGEVLKVDGSVSL